MLGVPVDDVTMAEAIDQICALVARGRASGRSFQVATVNVDFVVNSLATDDGAALLQQADLAIPDGMPLVWGSKALGTPLRQRVTGVDLLPALAARAAEQGYSLYFFGGAPGVGARAAERLRADHPVAITADAGPQAAVVGAVDAEAVAAIRAVDPDIVCVALGNPKQERWIARHRHVLGVPVLIGVGGTFDLLVGEKRRAPQWMRRSGLEWLFRAAQEPRRLARRYAHDLVVFLPRLVGQAWSLRASRAAPWQPAVVVQDGDRVALAPQGRLTAADLRRADVSAALDAAADIGLDLAGVPFFDNATAAALVAVTRQARVAGVAVTPRGLTPTARRCLARLRLDGALSVPLPAGPPG